MGYFGNKPEALVPAGGVAASDNGGTQPFPAVCQRVAPAMHEHAERRLGSPSDCFRRRTGFIEFGGSLQTVPRINPKHRQECLCYGIGRPKFSKRRSAIGCGGRAIQAPKKVVRMKSLVRGGRLCYDASPVCRQHRGYAGEQSQNVYENKGLGKKVVGWRKRCS